MATRTDLPSSHYATQAGLAATFARIIRAEWSSLDRTRLYALLTRFSQASATLSAQDYASRRREAGIRSGFTVPHAAPPTREHFDKTLNWVFDVVSDDTLTPEQRAVAGMTRLATQTGRLTTVEAVQADRQARAWARETRGGCCYFCALMAARGAVYKSEGAAGGDANARFTGEGAFKFHNNCHCVAVPVFGVYEKPADARGWNRQYHDLKRELGRAPSLLEWRNVFDGATTNVPQIAGT
jgi:hypothetical protein